jgi:hypothetical protein
MFVDTYRNASLKAGNRHCPRNLTSDSRSSCRWAALQTRVAITDSRTKNSEVFIFASDVLVARRSLTLAKAIAMIELRGGAVW